jgi:hypothetical protein
MDHSSAAQVLSFCLVADQGPWVAVYVRVAVPRLMIEEHVRARQDWSFASAAVEGAGLAALTFLEDRQNDRKPRAPTSHYGSEVGQCQHPRFLLKERLASLEAWDLEGCLETLASLLTH